MQGQPAAFNPHNFQDWYEHLAHINPPLSAALERLLSAGRPLTDDVMFDLHAIYVAKRDADFADQLQREVYGLLDSAASEAILGSSEVETLQARIAQTAAELPTESRSPEVAQLLSQIRELCELTRAYSSALARRGQEARGLGERFMRLTAEGVIDPLTGLRNRRGFEEAVARLKDQGVDFTRAAFAMIDIDSFKAINDSHGHFIGDKVIRAVAQIVQASIKGRDVAVRLGGDELGFLLPDTNLAGVMAVAEQIRLRVQKLSIHRANKEVVGTVTISAGVSASEPTLEELMGRADSALYRAKQQGRNRVIDSRNGTT
jgi:diguanylate cyclase